IADTNNTTATSTISGTATGTISLTHNLPISFSASVNQITGVITVSAASIHRPAINETFSIEITRQGAKETLEVAIDLPASGDPLVLNPDSVAINSDNLTRTVNVEGHATGEITLTPPSDLPSAVVVSVNQSTSVITITGTRPPHGTETISGSFDIKVTRDSLEETFSISVNLPPADQNFTPVTSIGLSTTVGRVGTAMNMSELATLFPGRAANAVPTVNDIVWEVISTTTLGSGTFDAAFSGSSLVVAGTAQGTVRVRATIPNGRANNIDFTQDFTLTFSNMSIEASVEGLEGLFSGLAVNGRVVFKLTGGIYAEEIFPSDFWITGLPWGLRTEEAERLSDTEVAIKITGAPNSAITSTWSLSIASSIPSRNFRHGITATPVTPFRFTFGEITQSAGVSPGSFTFDLNPHGWQHRDVSIYLNERDFRLREIQYGTAILREDTDYTENLNNNYTIHRVFLEKLPVGQWELTFRMNGGGNPTVLMNIIDTSRDTSVAPSTPVGPPPAPPMTPVHPDENFMYLTGGISVNLNNLRWDLNRARVTPQFQSGVATLTVRTHVLDNMSWNAPGTTLEIITPMNRIHIPTNILDTTIGARTAIISRLLNYNQVDMRISITDRSDDETLNYMFNYMYPNGELLTSLVELKIELVNIQTDEVIFTAREFTSPIQMSFVVMNNAGHLRPAGVMFARQWLEFVPYRSPSPNEIVTSSIFPGVQGVMHNRVHFEDISLTHWGFVQSYTAAYSGLTAPMDALSPETVITRGEFAQLVASALQLPRENAIVSGFSDINASNVYFDAVSRLYAAGILGTNAANLPFNPNSLITREEMAAIAGMALINGSPVGQQDYRPLGLVFIDSASINANHFTNVQTAVSYGIMSGYPDQTFRPHGTATRIYALQVVMNLAGTLGYLDMEE
ncbi:MAG: S-layer homology domain-containing protein, partial [Clostridiales bacterium]|nr:S-layer homology domain-containing protein [Clostridiales bacterium]